MNSIIGCRVRGASHIRANTVCQDYYKIIDQPGYTIMAIADGHGSVSCPYSDEGSRIAAHTFCSILEKYYEQYFATEDGLLLLESFLRADGSLTIAKQIEREWKKNIFEWHKERKRDIPVADDEQKIASDIYHQYGTTLLGIMVTKCFIFAFQLGDGDITYIDTDHIMPLIQSEKILGVETYSLSGAEAWKRAISSVIKCEENSSTPCLYMLSTDGMANSFSSQEEFYKAAADYYALFQGKQFGNIQESIISSDNSNEENGKKSEHGTDSVENTGIGYLQKNLSNWLQETSELGCGDDITVIFYYHEPSLIQEHI